MLLALLLAAAAPAVAAPATLIDALKANRLDLSSHGPGSYGGAGWQRLVEEGRQSRFFMVGEQHGTADIAAFEVALQRRLMDEGYTHLALEMGPYSARFAERLERARAGAVAAYLRQPGHGFAIPFLFFADELPLIEDRLARATRPDPVVWGLDQEFAGAMPILLAELRQHARTPAQRAALDGLEARAAADPVLIAALTPQDADTLAAAFATAGQPALDIIAALRTTIDIYGPYTRRTGPVYASNLTRETYMKRNLVAAFDAAARSGPPPKVFLKFGGNHAMRGMSGTNVPALGNFLAEWGLSRGYATTNIFVDCAGGRMLVPQTKEAAPCEPYFGEGANPIEPAVGDAKVTMFDLKAVRPLLGRYRAADPRLRELVLAFDYFIVIRDVAPSTPVSPTFGRR